MVADCYSSIARLSFLHSILSRTFNELETSNVVMHVCMLARDISNMSYVVVHISIQTYLGAWVNQTMHLIREYL